MCKKTRSMFLCASLGIAFLGSSLLPVKPAQAQLLSTNVAPDQDATNTPLYTADRVLDDIGKTVGAKVYADATTSAIRVLEPKETTTNTNFRQHLDDVVAQLPGGSTLAKLYLPEAPAGRTWTGDDVAAYAVAATRLYGPPSTSNPAGTVQILTQRVPVEKAKDYIAQLHLKVVYVVFNANITSTTPINVNQYNRAGLTQNGQNGQNQGQTRARGNMFRNLTPDQRQQLQNMTPQQRAAWMQQYRNSQNGQ